MKYREVARKLRQLGCDELPRRGKGSHRIWLHPPTGKIASLPDHGSKDLKQGTIRAAVRSLGLDWSSFEQA